MRTFTSSFAVNSYFHADSGISTLVNFVLMALFRRQAAVSSTAAGLSRVSRYTFLIQSLIDAISFVGVSASRRSCACGWYSSDTGLSTSRWRSSPTASRPCPYSHLLGLRVYCSSTRRYVRDFLWTGTGAECLLSNSLSSLAKYKLTKT